MGSVTSAMAFRASAKLAQAQLCNVHRATQRRTGVLGVKCGMLTEWDDWGMPQPLTVIKIDNCIVSQVKTEDKEGYTALQLGAIDKKIKRTTKPLIGHFEKANSAPDALLPAGTELFAAHF